jgi:hypothetical protein
MKLLLQDESGLIIFVAVRLECQMQSSRKYYTCGVLLICDDSAWLMGCEKPWTIDANGPFLKRR